MKKYKVNVLQKIFKRGIEASLLMSLFIFLSSAAPVKIMPLGDSITNENYRDDKFNAGGTEEIPEANRTAYRQELLNLLQADNYSVDYVGSLNSGSAVMTDADHEGHNGWTDNNITDNVFDFLTANPAEVVLLHIGTNGDINDDSAADVDATLEEIDRYEIANNTHIKVVLARIIDCWDGWDAAAATPAKTLICDATFKTHIQNFNTNLDAMVTSRVAAGDDITVVDMQTGAGLDYNATDMIDDLHPNVTGYAKMANAWYTALETVIPTHQWKLDETIDPYADMYRDANGTCVVNCPVSVTGQIGSGQRFDGADDEIELAYDNSYDWNRTDSFTVSFWMNAATGGISTTEVFIGRDDRPTTNVQWWVGYDATTGYVKFSLIDSNDVRGSIENTAHVVNDNLWHHITVVRDGIVNTDAIYVDGILGISAPSVAYTGDFAIANKGITLGNLSSANTFDYNGSLDEVTMFNAALSAEQVKQLHSQGLGNLSITTTPATTAATVDITYLYDVNTSNDVDAQGNFSLTNAIGDMAIDVDGIFTWTPAAMVNTQVSIVASDGTRSDTQVLDLKARITDKLPTGMQHYWQLDEVDPVDKTYLDANNSATPGTDALCNTGCPTQVVGQIGNAQDFAGVVSDLNISDDNSFDWAAGDNFSIELWMNPTTLGQHNIPLGRNAGTMGWRIGSNPTDNVEISFRDTNGIEVLLTGNAVNAGTWYHIALVRDAGNTFTLYVNGTEVNSTIDISTGNFSGTTPIIMANFSNNGFPYDGLMDDVAIFSTILSANDIKAHYNNGLAGNGFENPDTTLPIITLLGSTPVEVERGTVYTDTGATATDDIDGNITANMLTVNPVDANTVGEYNVTYNVSDAAGNTATEVVRTVNVVDKTIPVITRLGSEPASVVLGVPYVDAGASATDDVDGNITVNIVTVNTVDENTLGQYIVTYNVSDAAGNQAVQVTRTVNVVDAGTPVITLLGTTPVEIFLGTAYVDAGATATDDVDGDITANIVAGGDTVDINTIGDYNVTYNVSDAAGNPAVEVVRTVRVIADNVAPVITLVGTTPVTVEQGTSYIDAGATATDNIDGTITANIVTVNPVDTNTVGAYTVTYNVSDAAGNAAVQVTRTVNVVAPTDYTFEDNGTTKTYTSKNGGSVVTFDDAVGVKVEVVAGKVIFTTTDASGKEAYIEMFDDGSIVTGYRQAGSDTPTVTTSFPAGAKTQMVQDGADTVIIIDTALTTDLTFGGL